MRNPSPSVHNEKGLLHLDAEGIFFAPKLYADTARGRKNDKKRKIAFYVPYLRIINHKNRCS